MKKMMKIISASATSLFDDNRGTLYYFLCNNDKEVIIAREYEEDFACKHNMSVLNAVQHYAEVETRTNKIIQVF